MIAVTFALPAESPEFLRRLGNKSPADRNGVRVIRGKIDSPERIGAREPFRSREIEILHTGVGEKVCRERLQKFLHDHQFELLISTGFAGALTDELTVGDLFLAKNFSTFDLNESGSLVSSLSIHVADLLTMPSLIESGDERKKIGRSSGAAAVDMETEFIARVCAAHRVPLLSLRVITDTPRKPFPAPAHILFDIAKQRTDLVKLGAFFLTHPNCVPQLFQFARSIARVRKSLATAIIAVVRSIDL